MTLIPPYSRRSAAPADVLVVGAGPVGLTAACDLARRGLRVRIVDRKDEPSAHSKALAVHARTLELFEKLNLAGPLLEAGVRVEAANIRDRERRLGRFALAPLDTPFPFVLSVPQSETETILAKALRQKGVAVEWRTTFEGLSQRSDAVAARLRMPDGKRVESCSAWLLGCDGADSTVRHVLGMPFDGNRFPEWFALADVVVENESVDGGALPAGARAEANGYLSPSGLLLLIPLPAGQHFRVVLTVPGYSMNSAPPLAPELFERALLDRAGLDLRIKEASWISAFRIHRRIAARYRQGRVFLAGDAAHVHSPVGGQGMNLGIQDAFNLAWKLALVQRGPGRSALLDSYEEERRPAALSTLFATTAATRAITLRWAPARQLRNRVIAGLSGFEFVRRRVMRSVSMIDQAYGKSAIVAPQPRRFPAPRDFTGGPLPGERAPDARLGEAGQRRLFDLLRGPEHVLLAFSGAGTGGEEQRRLCTMIAQAGKRFPAVFQVYFLARRRDAAPQDDAAPMIVDGRGEAHARYGAAGACAYLVRPDGYVGWRGVENTGRSLIEHLEKICAEGVSGAFLEPRPSRNEWIAGARR